MWRKTRSRDNNCFGADGNRNFGHHWGEAGASENPCSDTYRGTAPFSEVETQNIRNIGYKYAHKLAAYMAIHSYGGFFLYPWGYAQKLPPDWKLMVN